MIFIGYGDAEKKAAIERYCSEHDVRKTVVISADKFPLSIPGTDQIEYTDTIEYVTFYRLLQEIDTHTLVVINECLRTQNRYELTYNCIRLFLNQTHHQLIFQQLPQIDKRDDFMILFDFDTRSRWKRRKFDIGLILDNTQVNVRPLSLTFACIDVPTSKATKEKYRQERDRRFANLGVRDPHTLPRNLYLIGGKDKRAYVDACAQAQLPLFGDTSDGGMYVGRNKRLGRDNVVVYKNTTASECPYTIVEFPHRFIDFSDFIQRTGQAKSNVLVADLKVDRWYFKRYQEWTERINDTYASIQQ